MFIPAIIRGYTLSKNCDFSRQVLTVTPFKTLIIAIKPILLHALTLQNGGSKKIMGSTIIQT